MLLSIKDNFPYYTLLVFGVFLPFQFALNLPAGFDLAIIRVLILIVFIAWLFVIIKNKQQFHFDKIGLLLFAFFLLAILSLSFSNNLFWSLRKLFFLFSIIPIYHIATSVLNTQRKQRMLLVVLIGGASILAIIAIFQFVSQFIFGIDSVYAFLANNITPFFLGNSFSEAILAYPSWLVNANGTTYMRAIAIFPDPHMLSYYFGMLIPWSIALGATSKKYSFWFFFSATFLVIANICTFTRGGYVALIAGSLIVLPIVSRLVAKKILLGVAIIGLFFTIAPHSSVAERFSSSFDVNEGSNQARITNWQQALPVIKNNPLGVGIGMYALTVNPKADYREPIYAHNLYLDISAELGILSVLIFIAILFFAFTFFWQIAKQDPLFIGGVSSITIFAIHSLVETPLYSVHILTLFCIILALSMKINTHEKSKTIV